LAGKVHEILRKTASANSTINYKKLGDRIGIHYRGDKMNNTLDSVDRTYYQTYDCVITALVVRKREGTSSRGFYEMARELGFDVKNFDIDFWESHREKAMRALIDD